MTDNCKVFIRPQIWRPKFLHIPSLFALALTASQIAIVTNLNRKTVNRSLILTRSLIASFCQLESLFSGKLEGDQSSFGAPHKKEKRGRRAENKHIVFAISKRTGRVY